MQRTRKRRSRSNRLVCMLIAVALTPLVSAHALASPAMVVNNGVATARAGPYVPSITVPVGSTVWRNVGVVNIGTTSLDGLTFSDSAGALPATCPPIPASLAVGGSWSCIFSLPVAPGPTTYTATATAPGLSASGTAMVNGTASAAPGTASSKLGLASTPGTYTTATKAASLRRYVTWRAQFGSTAAGETVGVYVSKKGANGAWSAWTRHTGRVADSSGTVVYSRREATPIWLSVRFSADGIGFTRATQARWQ